MATVTPNFNWPVPTSTDLVKDGATAIEALGDSIDASLVDLKGGTTGQVLSKTSGTDMDFTWVTSDDANAIQNTIVDAKGDLIAATAADTPARLAVGTNGQVLTADSTASTGLAWATPSAGSTNVSGKNGVLNSAMNVWQRGTSIAIGGSSNGYTADRWQLHTQANQASTVSRQATNDTTNLPFIQYCARVQRNSGQTGTGQMSFIQGFETVNSLAYAGRQVTLSYYARAGANFSPTSNTFNFLIYTGTGTDQNPTGYTGGASVATSTVNLTTTWTRYTVTGTVSTTATEISLYAYWSATGTAGANDFVEITGVQLEIAGSASAYSANTSTYQAELAACQRYFQVIAVSQAWGTWYSTTDAALMADLPVVMRVTPTATFSTVYTNAIVEVGVTDRTPTAYTAYKTSNQAYSFLATGSTTTATVQNGAIYIGPNHLLSAEL